MVRLDESFAPQLCAFGGIVGSERTAAIWCRATSGGPYTVRATFDRAFSITGLVTTPYRTLAFDLAGTVYEELEKGSFVPRLESNVNSGCDPLCTAFSSVHTSATDSLAVLAGAGAEMLIVQDQATSVQGERPSQLSASLFGDERPGAEEPCVLAPSIAPRTHPYGSPR